MKCRRFVSLEAVSNARFNCLETSTTRYELAEQIADAERALDALRRRARDEADRRLLVAIARMVGGVFAVEDLVVLARRDPDVRAAIGAVSRKRLGQRLSRAAGRDLAGVYLHRVTRDRRGVIWHITLHPDPCAADPAGR